MYTLIMAGKLNFMSAIYIRRLTGKDLGIGLPSVKGMLTTDQFRMMPQDLIPGFADRRLYGVSAFWNAVIFRTKVGLLRKLVIRQIVRLNNAEGSLL